MTIYGLGGCGKSALVLEFAYRALARHGRHLVFWVPAVSQESFEHAFREIGIRLRIPGITDDNADVKQLVKKTLSSDSVAQWLMIVDNADDRGVLMGDTDRNPGSAQLLDYLSHSNRGKILFTTRSRKMAQDLTQSRVLELHDMSKAKAEARQLLARRISKPALLTNEKAVNELLEILTCLPLAIVQAAAFIDNNDISVPAYISLFQKAGAQTELFGEDFEDPSRYQEMERTIAKTWHISFDQIRRQDPLAAEYLSFMACIDRINVPQSLLPPAGSTVQQTKAIGTLKGYAFITERQQASQELGSGTFFDMHRLVHMASVWWLDRHGERTAWTAKAVARLEELIPYGGHGRKEVWTPCLSHAMHVAGLDGILGETARASLLDRVGLCQSSLGQYSAAETTHRQALSLREKSLGEEHHQTLVSMGEVATALYDQGNYKEAESMEKQTLVLMKKVLGSEHLYTVGSEGVLALILTRLGRYEEAESLNRQMLEWTEKVLGLEHPETLTSMKNLAVVLSGQGKNEEAESINRQALVQQEKVLGLEHPETLISMNNLAVVLSVQGKYEEAKSMNRQALVQQEKVLGLEHPETLKNINNLAYVLNCQGKYEEAESMNRQALVRQEKVLGLEHPDTLFGVYGLAKLLANRRPNDESMMLYERACTGFSVILGENHPWTRACQNDYSEALASSSGARRTLLTYTKTPDRDASLRTDRASKLSLGLAKIGIRSSIFSRQK